MEGTINPDLNMLVKQHASLLIHFPKMEKIMEQTSIIGKIVQTMGGELARITGILSNGNLSLIGISEGWIKNAMLETNRFHVIIID